MRRHSQYLTVTNACNCHAPLTLALKVATFFRALLPVFKDSQIETLPELTARCLLPVPRLAFHLLKPQFSHLSKGRNNF